MTDDLRQSLQRRNFKEKLLAKLPSRLQVVSALCLAAFAGFGYWAVSATDPVGTEPVVNVAIDTGDPLVTASVDRAEEEPLSSTGETPEWELEDSAGDSGGDVVIEIDDRPVVRPKPPQPAQVALAPAPQRDIFERGSGGGLPRISKSGRKPLRVYARPVAPAVAKSKKPKIALVIGGMGINANLTRIAITDLPGAVTFAFAPYGSRLQYSVNEARADGHEVLLHLPLEPLGYPSVNPGPRTLLVKSDAAANLNNLHWLMGRFSGYVGVANYLGSRFAADSQALLPVMEEIKKRGLLYLDDGSFQKSQAVRLGKLLEAPTLRGDIIIDTKKDLNAILAALDQLEEIARKRGVAIGSGTGLSGTINAIKQWSDQAEEKGILLIPVSAAFAGRRS